MTTSYLIAIAVITLVCLAAVTDWRERRIPNLITLPAMVLGMAFHAVLPSGEGLLFALSGFALGVLLLILPYLLGGGGMGDIKLLGALGAWLGPKWLLVAFATGILVGVLLTLVCLITNRPLEDLLCLRRNKDAWQAPRSGKIPYLRNRKSLPFAVPLAIGTCLMVGLVLTRGGF